MKIILDYIIAQIKEPSTWVAGGIAATALALVNINPDLIPPLGQIAVALLTGGLFAHKA